MSKSLNQNILITGASSDIGCSIAIELAKSGFDLIISARSIDKLKVTKEKALKYGVKCAIHPADLSSLTSTNELIEKVKLAYTHLHAIINVAAIWHDEDSVFANKKLSTYTQKEIIDTLKVGIHAPILLAHGLYPLLKHGSKIINITGTFSGGGKGWIPYYVAKRALEDMTVAMSDEFLDDGIEICAVSPADVATQELKKYFPSDSQDALEPSVVGEFVANLCLSRNGINNRRIWVLRKNQNPVDRFHA